ncbi:MAG: PLP-dependent cysteine synthase family protein [Clostridia bacterium]|nr:PLP-dependent cysteine synthase family protein [Clostridia bacterium]
MIEKLIGKTPMLKVNFRRNGVKQHIFAKAEWFNLTGSIKDRAAVYMIKKAKERGTLKDGQPIIEATSGNMGISIAAIGACYHHPVHIFMPDWMTEERKKILIGYGAILHNVSKNEGGFRGAITMADELAKQIGGFRTSQFSNEDNSEAHYYGTGREILKDLDGITIAGFVSGIGTGGTLMGVGRCLKEADSSVKIYAFEPDTLSTMINGVTEGDHKIAGIGDGFVPELVKESFIDSIDLIHDEDAIQMAKKLSRELGLGVGISAGANFLAASKLAEKGNIVTVFPDDNKKYLSTDLAGELEAKEGYLSSEIELLDYEVM